MSFSRRLFFVAILFFLRIMLAGDADWQPFVGSKFSLQLKPTGPGLALNLENGASGRAGVTAPLHQILRNLPAGTDTSFRGELGTSDRSALNMKIQDDQVILALVAIAPALVDSLARLVRELRPIAMLLLLL